MGMKGRRRRVTAGSRSVAEDRAEARVDAFLDQVEAELRTRIEGWARADGGRDTLLALERAGALVPEFLPLLCPIQSPKGFLVVEFRGVQVYPPPVRDQS